MLDMDRVVVDLNYKNAGYHAKFWKIIECIQKNLTSTQKEPVILCRVCMIYFLN